MWQNPAPVLITSSWAARAVWVVLEEWAARQAEAEIIVEMAAAVAETAEHQDRVISCRKRTVTGYPQRAEQC